MPDTFNIYGGQDGVIDYETPVAVMALADTQVVIAAQTLPANTIWHYVRRREKGDCALESADSPSCIIRIGADGQMLGDTPNAPTDLFAEGQAGGVVRLRWRCSSAGQETPPAGFVIFIYNEDIPASILNWYRKPLTEGDFRPASDAHPWAFSDGWFGPSGKRYDYQVPMGLVASGIGRNNEFTWTSPALTHGKMYRFIVRAYSAAGLLSQNTNAVAITADAIGPAAIEALSASWEVD